MFHRILLAGAIAVALTGNALAQSDGARVPSQSSPNAVYPTPQPGGRSASDVSSGSQSGTVSTGTGVGSEGTATGGPVGGNTSRN